MEFLIILIILIVVIVLPNIKVVLERRIVAFEEDGMEAMHSLLVNKMPVIIAAAHGKSIF